MPGMTNREQKSIRTSYVQYELESELLKTIQNFKSKQYPRTKLNHRLVLNSLLYVTANVLGTAKIK